MKQTNIYKYKHTLAHKHIYMIHIHLYTNTHIYIRYTYICTQTHTYNTHTLVLSTHNDILYKTGLVYGQALRIVERCSNEQDVEKHLQNLKKKLIDRNYPKEIVEKQISRPQQKDRKSLIFKKKQMNQTDKKVRLIFTYNQSNPPIEKWIRQSRKYLDKNYKSKDLGRNIQIA